ncbi:hypothetical protein [Roseibium sediminis]|uniref:hypothetical protein n=1 Tax=Roseibium sediminis TaxID=1775174 RepID=UPI00123D01A1|nr:hypothetical protein [Roseibium sediminis]
MAGMSDAALGLDDRYGTHAYDKCSYAGYVAEQFYQYAAAMKMVYVLATDEAARSQLIDAINEGISGSSVVRFLSSASNEFAAQRLQDPLLIEMVTGASSDAVASALGLPGSRPESDFDLDEINSIHSHLAKQRLNSARYQAEKQRAMSDLKNGATSYWREIKRRHSECGFMYAALTVSTDGAFVLGGLALGAGLGAAAIKAMRSIKFFAARVVNGKIKVTAKHDLTGGKIEREFTTKELEEDFGTPDKNHAGTSDNEANVPTGEGKKKNGGSDRDQDTEKTDEWPDGSYRNPDDVQGMRRAEDGEAMIKDRNGDWTRVSQIPKTDNVWKGQWGEAVADQKARQDGWEKINGPDTQITGKDFRGRGIDGIYRNPKPPPDYFVTDAKTGKSGLNTTTNGKQLSDKWIKHHLQEMVRNKQLTKDQMDDILESNQPLVQRVTDDGKVKLETKDKTPFRSED